MNLSWIRDLDSLSRTRNFSRAAELNNISQPAFSRRIKALEHWAGATLIDRSTHPVDLTEAGLQLLEAGNQAISRLETERDNIRDTLAQPDRYVVTFATQHSIGWRFYPAWLQLLEQEFGPIISRLRADDLPNCIDALEKGETDFVISYASNFSTGIESIHDTESLSIGSDSLVPVCKPGPDGSALFDLDQHDDSPVPYLRFGDVAPIRQHLEPVLSTLQQTDRLQVVYENSMAGALRVRARDGLGVAWLPESLVRPDIEAGLLVILSDQLLRIDLSIQLHRVADQSNSMTRRIWMHLAQIQSTRSESG